MSDESWLVPAREPSSSRGSPAAGAAPGGPRRRGGELRRPRPRHGCALGRPGPRTLGRQAVALDRRRPDLAGRRPDQVPGGGALPRPARADRERAIARPRPRRRPSSDATLLKLWPRVRSGGPHLRRHHPRRPVRQRRRRRDFELNRPLWNHESRGGDLFTGEGRAAPTGTARPPPKGEFAPGIHSIVVDPRNPDRLLVAVSTAGVLETDRRRQELAQAATRGMLNDYLPEPGGGVGARPALRRRCARRSPTTSGSRTTAGVFYSADGARHLEAGEPPDAGVHFGFPSPPTPTTASTAWVVPGKADMQRMAIDGGLFVARTQDGGADLGAAPRRPAAGERLRRHLPPRARQPAAIASPSAAPPATSTSAKTAARAGGRRQQPAADLQRSASPDPPPRVRPIDFSGGLLIGSTGRLLR